MSLEYGDDTTGAMGAITIADRAAELGVEEEEYRTLLRLFATHAGREAAAIRAALEAEDREEVSRLAHSLKGASVSLGLSELAAMAATLEAGAPSVSRVELASLALGLQQRLARFEELVGDEPSVQR